jgi:bZIP Maf transcription factor
LDEKTIKDLIGDDDDEGESNDEASKLKDKARNRLKNRIAQETKARNRRAGRDDDNNEEEETDVSAFAKKKGK